MGIRVTVVLSEINNKKLRKIQAKMIDEGDNASFSRTLNVVVAQALKDYKF